MTWLITPWGFLEIKLMAVDVIHTDGDIYEGVRKDNKAHGYIEMRIVI